jgi:hypothetical protein
MKEGSKSDESTAIQTCCHLETVHGQVMWPRGDTADSAVAFETSWKHCVKMRLF